MQPPLPLVGEAIEQKATRAGHGTRSLLSLLWWCWVCQCLFSRAAGLEACEVPMEDGHMVLEAALPTATAQRGSRKAGKNFMHPGIPNLFGVAKGDLGTFLQMKL